MSDKSHLSHRSAFLFLPFFASSNPLHSGFYLKASIMLVNKYDQAAQRGLLKDAGLQAMMEHPDGTHCWSGLTSRALVSA